MMRALKGLEAAIPVSVVNWLMLEQGWTFDPGPGVVADPVNHARVLHQVYTAADPHYTGRVTVPVLWDRQRGTIVNNESAELLRMLGNRVRRRGGAARRLLPRRRCGARSTPSMPGSTTR